MSVFYVDESIHPRGGFIVTAAVYAAYDMNDLVCRELQECGFDPTKDEYKSSMSMASNPAARELRGRLTGLIWEHCKVAIAVCSTEERAKIADFTLSLLRGLNCDAPIKGAVVYFDEGIKLAKTLPPEGWTARYGCDSRQMGGIQLADCAAHTLSTVLLGELGLVTKMVEVGDSYPEPEVELTWQLWADLRQALSSGIPEFAPRDDGLVEPMMKPFGISVSGSCSEALKEAVDFRLSGIWVGCIH